MVAASADRSIIFCLRGAPGFYSFTLLESHSRLSSSKSLTSIQGSVLNAVSQSHKSLRDLDEIRGYHFLDFRPSDQKKNMCVYLVSFSLPAPAGAPVSSRRPVMPLAMPLFKRVIAFLAPTLIGDLIPLWYGRFTVLLQSRCLFFNPIPGKKPFRHISSLIFSQV